MGQKEVYEFLKANPGVEFTAKELVSKLNMNLSSSILRKLKNSYKEIHWRIAPQNTFLYSYQKEEK